VLENKYINNVVVIGYSGHAFVVVDAAIDIGLNVTHYSDKVKSKNNPFQLNYLGYEHDNDFFNANRDFDYILGVGCNKIRKKNHQFLFSENKNILNVIHPSASVSKYVKIGNGTFISKNTAINTLSAIKDGCIINTGAIIEHECVIGNYSHIGPGAVLAGNVVIGDGCFIGANSFIKEGVRIGNNVIIGAGSVVLEDVLDGDKIVGNPAKKI
jgi:sugar O-acyltransferase (sialic acid O-acetyltransferase NeuD family)